MKNKLLGLFLVIVVLFTSGCGANNYIKDKNNKIVQYEKTGQSLPNNILCKPKNKELHDLYEKYSNQLKTDWKKLPECENFKVTSTKSSGVWEHLFVKPLAYAIIKVGSIVKNMGISLIIIGLLIRIVLIPFSYKTHKQSKNMAKVQKEMQKLEFKYRGRDDYESMMLKTQEMRAIYKKYNASPTSGCLIAFIQLPVFFAFLQAVNRTPAIFEDNLLGFNLGMTPYVGLQNGNYLYLLLVLLIALSTYYSFKYTMNNSASMNNNEMADQMSMMTNIMTILIIVTSFSLSTALSFYWIVTYAFIAIQTYIFKRISKDNKEDKKDKKKKNSIKEKLEVKEKLKYGTNK